MQSQRMMRLRCTAFRMILPPRLQAVAEAGAGLKSSRTAVRDLSCGSRAHLFWHVLTTSTSIGDEEEVVDSDASVELDVDEDVSDDEVSIDDDVASIDEGEVVGAS